jgi:hypothetical protein
MSDPPHPPWPGYPPPPYRIPPPSAPRNAGDLTASIITMVFTVLLVGAGAMMGLFSLAFLDHCPPETCSVDGAVTASTSTVVIAGLIAVAGIITTIVRLVQRKAAWPFAIGTLVLCLAVFFLGAMAFTAAVS